MQDRKHRLNCKLKDVGGIGLLEIDSNLENMFRDRLQKVFEKVVQDSGFNALVVDLSKVKYIASFSIAAIGYYYKKFNERGGYLVLVIGHEQVRKAFRLAGLLEIIPVFENAEEALQAIGSQKFG